MKSLLVALPFAAAWFLSPASAHAEKFGFCDNTVKSAVECFNVMIQETYRKCRIVQSMMIIEYGFADSYLSDNNGEKLNSCIEKHRKGIQIPYHAAEKELTKHKSARKVLAELHRTWLNHTQALIPALVETLEGYETRVQDGTEDLLAKMTSVQSVFSDALVVAKKKTARALPTRLTQK